MYSVFLLDFYCGSFVILVCCIFPQYDHKRISCLAQRLVKNITNNIPDVILNGDAEQRYPGINWAHGTDLKYGLFHLFRTMFCKCMVCDPEL